MRATKKGPHGAFLVADRVSAHPYHDFQQFDWRKFQQEYRDYIDLAKLVQMIPVVGAPIGALVNWKLLERLGRTAMNSYRMRWLAHS